MKKGSKIFAIFNRNSKHRDMHPFTDPNTAQDKVKLVPIWWLTLLSRETDAFPELHAGCH